MVMENKDTMTAVDAIQRMGDPTEWFSMPVLSCQIDFLNCENGNQEDETSFDIDCSQPNWRDELLSCWEEFRKENKLPDNCVTGAWATVV